MKMKPNLLDRFIGYVSPNIATKRLQNRLKQDLLVRAYDAAKNFRTSDWTSASGKSANEEIKADQKVIRERSRDLTRNNPYGVRAVNVITSSTVGAGIVANITGPNAKKTAELRKLWREWAETTNCDATGRHNFYGLQNAILRTTVESGEGLATSLGIDASTGPKIKLLESDYIKSDLDKDDGTLVQGIYLTATGAPKAYALYKRHPGDNVTSDDYVTVPASDVSHVYRQERPGQIRGVPWAHAVIEVLKDFDDYQRATLIGRKIAACFSVFITTNGNDSLLSPEDLKSKRESDMSLTPATVRYLNNGESIQIAAPPAVSGYSEFIRESLRSVAAGFGISYEAMTGDFSQSNYSSSRMGEIGFRKNIESWRWNMLIPQFCDWGFGKFKEFASVKLNIKPEDISVEWVPPAYEMIDPVKDLSAIQRAVRTGLMTLPQAIRAQGYDPDTQLKEISETNKKLDSFGIALDSDPRKVSQVGLVQSIDPNQISESTEEGNTTSEQKNNEGSAAPNQGGGN
jgi:lambda family phage portal protein